MRSLFLALAIALPLAACQPHGNVALNFAARPVLPDVPEDLAPCFARVLPEIPAHGFGRRDAVRIIGDAILLDRAKTACGERAVSWIRDVQAAFGRPAP